MPNRTEATPRKPRQQPPGDYRYCACSRLHSEPPTPSSLGASAKTGVRRGGAECCLYPTDGALSTLSARSSPNYYKSGPPAGTRFSRLNAQKRRLARFFCHLSPAKAYLDNDFHAFYATGDEPEW